MKTVTVIGLGYVGLPLACLCAEKGYKVYGLDTDKNKVDAINNNQSPIEDEYVINKLKKVSNKIQATDNASNCVPNSNIIIVCVPTPTDKNHIPNLEYIEESSKSIAKYIKKDTLIIIESTVFPGTTEEIIKPLLEKSNLSIENDLFLAHCPERIDPGNKKWNIENLPRVAGGITKESAKKAIEFYKSIIDADIIGLSSIKAAEATKIMENTFRDINIAFINEMAMGFDKEGIDILEVIKGASTKPFAFMPHYPGIGVGGHCIPVDPYYLIEKAKQVGFSHKFLNLGREINNNMPNYTVKLLEEELQKIKKSIKNAKIGVLGLAYKANVDDTRESPALKIIKILKEKNAEIFIFDPYVKEKSNVKDVVGLLEKSDYIVLVTDHKEFKDMDLKKLKENNVKIIIDGRNCLDKEKIKALGILYHGIGRY